MFRLQKPKPGVPLETLNLLRRQGFGLLAPLSALAALLALVFQRGNVDPLDKMALPLIAVLMLGLELSLRRHWLKLERALNLTYGVCSAYLLALFYHQFSSFVPRYGMLSEGVLWFPVLYMMAFILWTPRRAAQVVGTQIGLTLLITFAQTVPLWQSGRLGDRLLASLAQFFLSGILIALVQYVVGSARQQYEDMRRLAYVDTLTGLPNRRAAQSLLDRLDSGQQPYALVLFDLDYFKQVNDRYGHAEGDMVLTQTAQLCGQHLAAPNLLARWGGEEFLMILPNVSAEAARAAAERARSNLAAYSFASGPVTASFGVAQTAAEGGHSPHEQVLEIADLALRQAKASGRNQVRAAGDGPDPLIHLSDPRKTRFG
ncbi:hypothetical protein GCM10022631_41990 [Deinococcus rubellus]|uniref:GGDEF domain-containing protein n=1 Tax=Deinococcus rubellus TaxID=1889240 RepID=A0ABY5YMN7_9DEIO|nr:GGDEF domain-containing protein [Deinococcus rubellus]UWX65018.1 GGDEF domain-containing protein [Deinococcus rubellus]